MSENGTAPKSGPFRWVIDGTVTDVTEVGAVIERVALALRRGDAFNIVVRDQGLQTQQRYNVKQVQPVDAVENARLRDVAQLILKVSGANVLQVKPEAAALVPTIDGLFRELRAIIDRKPLIILPR